MPSPDHKAEALRAIADADEEGGKLEGGDSVRVGQLQAEAQIYSNLAIAEGQERVAEVLEGRANTFYRESLGCALGEIAGLAVDLDADNDNEVRKRIYRIADEALKRLEPGSLTYADGMVRS